MCHQRAVVDLSIHASALIYTFGLSQFLQVTNLN